MLWEFQISLFDVYILPHSKALLFFCLLYPCLCSFLLGPVSQTNLYRSHIITPGKSLVLFEFAFCLDVFEENNFFCLEKIIASRLILRTLVINLPILINNLASFN